MRNIFCKITIENVAYICCVQYHSSNLNWVYIYTEAIRDNFSSKILSPNSKLKTFYQSIKWKIMKP